MTGDFIPATENGRKSWADNLILKFEPLALNLGFKPTETEAFFDDLTMLKYVITASQSAAAESKARTAYKKQMLDGLADGSNALPLPMSTLPAPPANLVAPDVIGRLRKFIARIKAAPNYNDAIGEQLQITGTEAAKGNPAEAKPTFEAAAEVGKVMLNWVKSDFDGVIIESKRGAETVFSFFDKDFKSPCIDTRPNLAAGQPEVRRYRMIYLINDETVGTYSDEVVATTKT